MATATLRRPVERTVLLELTESEALTLVTLSDFIAGPPGGRRKHITDIAMALSEAIGGRALRGQAHGCVYLDTPFRVGM